MEKLILDACCGGRMFRFNKQHPHTIYNDIRATDPGYVLQRPNFEVKPDTIMDFCSLDYPDKTFKLVVMDPPHLKSLGEKSRMCKKYGKLRHGRQGTIQKGFQECWRVLDDYGTLIFKRNESEVKLSEILSLLDKDPLFGHTSGRYNKTIWLCFMKIPT